jgi:hypothetical protein
MFETPLSLILVLLAASVFVVTLARRLGLDWSLCAAESAWRGGLCCQFLVAREALALLALCGWRAAFLATPPSIPEPDR